MNFGHWITSPQLSRNCVTADPPSPAPLFRRAFECSGFTTGRVRLSGVGYHELYLNGRKVGDRVLDPAVSCYEKRVRFVTFDITEYLHPGTNVVGVILGNGWYNPSTAEVWNFFKAPWRDCVKFTIELEIDGRLVLGADESWKCTSGPILFDALRNGETYDARCEIDGWLGERYDDSGWLSAVRIAGPGGMLDEQKMPPCKVLQTIPMTLHPAGRVYDAGQNLSGWARIAVQGEAGVGFVKAPDLQRRGGVCLRHGSFLLVKQSQQLAEFVRRDARRPADLGGLLQAFLRPALLFFPVKVLVRGGHIAAPPHRCDDKAVPLQFLVGFLDRDDADVQ